MYTREKIKEVVKECLQYYTMGDNKTDKEEKENFVESVMKKIKKPMKEYNFNKYDLAIIGEMVTLLSKKCELEQCGEIVIKNINNNSKHIISTDWNKVSSFIKKLEQYEVESFGFKGGRR